MLATVSTQKTKTANAGPKLQRTFVMENIHGLHARPAALLCRLVSHYDSQVTADCAGEIANARSLLGLLGLAVGMQSKVTFTAVGPDAAEVLDAIGELFHSRFAEAY